MTPADEHPAVVDAARRVDGLHNRLFLDPLLRGGYPDDVRTDLAGVTDFGFEQPGDAAVIAAPLDLLGVNYYTRYTVTTSPLPGTATATTLQPPGTPTASGWGVQRGRRRIAALAGPQDMGAGLSLIHI